MVPHCCYQGASQVKTYSSSPQSYQWAWTTYHLPPGISDGTIITAMYEFPKSRIYTLQISGLSSGFSFDRIVLYKSDELKFDFATSTKLKESQRTPSPPTVPPPTNAPIKKAPTNVPVKKVPTNAPIKKSPTIAPAKKTSTNAPIKNAPVRAPVVTPSKFKNVFLDFYTSYI